MHNQHRSPDPTKIERATATSTVALFFFLFFFPTMAVRLQLQFVCNTQSWVSNVALPSSPWVIHSGIQLTRLNCLSWLSIRLFNRLSFCLFINHSSPLTHFPMRTIWHWLRPVLFYNLTFTLRWLIQQCLSAQPLCGCRLPPFVNPS